MVRAGTLALERMARAWALLHGRSYVTTGDIEHLFLPVLGHRVVFAPSFVAETRRQGHGEALRRFREAVFAAVERPEADWEPSSSTASAASASASA